MDMNDTPEPRMPLVENLEFLDLMGVISSPCTTSAGCTRPWATKLRRRRGRPRRALWICRCAWTTLARRPQLHRANNSKTRYISDEEEERPSPHKPTPVVL